jgi:laccase
MGMTAVFIVEDGPTANTSLPPPPADFPSCSRNDNHLVSDAYHLQTPKIKVSRIGEI